MLFAAVTAITAAVVWVLLNNYFFNAKSELDSKSPQQQKEELLADEEYQDLPEVIALKELVAEAKNYSSDSEANNTAKLHTANSGEQQQNNSKSAVPSKQELENDLIQKLVSLQSEYNGKLNSLLASAIKEYQQIKNGQKSGSVKELALKYIELGEAYEAECDARVYAAIAYTEIELAKYNYTTEITDQAREQYIKEKNERRKQLLSKVK